jgi:type II secretory ATPase GspE/PulE/Tfp pilus assembly ATPase PilB-like protein
MGVPRFLVAFTCNIIVAQRLVRKLCKECKTPYKIDKKQLKELSEIYDVDHLTELLRRDGFLGGGETLDKVDFYHGAGCKQCNGEGYKGRMGIYEVLEVTKAIQDLINKDAANAEMLETAEKEGMIPIVEDGFAKAIKGLTSLEEIMRVTKE